MGPCGSEAEGFFRQLVFDLGRFVCDLYFAKGGPVNHAGYSVLAAHAVHLLLLGDFGYFYFKNLATKGVDAPLNLSDCWEV